MVSQAELARVVRRARERSARVRVTFKGLRYALVIDGYVKAEDVGGRSIEWSRAFGSLTPAEALTSLPLEDIEVSLPDRSFKLKGLKELLSWAL
jgi:hypothetical protein